ncbi:MAG: CoA-binding protein, partial [Myxococcota bacterium]
LAARLVSFMVDYPIPTREWCRAPRSGFRGGDINSRSPFSNIQDPSSAMDRNAAARADHKMKRLFEETRTIAVVGIKDGPLDDAYRVPEYMRDQGYTIIPVNPKITQVLGIKAHPSLGEIPSELLPIDVVNLFRASEHLPAHVEEILSLSPRPNAVWTQLGIHDSPSAKRLRAAGIEVIQDRCIMVDHRRLFGPSSRPETTRLNRLQIPVHYDFASSLCYVTHRLMNRMGGFLSDLELELLWTPLDLARLMGWRPSDPVPPHRVEHVRQVAEALDVPFRVPERWIDSRPGSALALALGLGSEADDRWRERVFSAIYDEGVRPDHTDDWASLLRELEYEVTASELAAAGERVRELTQSASEQMVTGVPTFMLGPWPMGGIQEEETMRSLLGRWAGQQRQSI